MPKSLLLIFGIALMISCTTTSVQTVGEEKLTYERDIKPIIDNYCITCHSGKSPPHGLYLTELEHMKKAAEMGILTNRINSKSDPMPPKGRLPKETRDLIGAWVEQGMLDGESAMNEQPKFEFTPPTIKPVCVKDGGVKLLESINGHWVGKMEIMGQKIPWFSFDYRSISPSHVYGIYEGGTMGNLMTSFFVTKIDGVQTVVARSGGVLNGIYRMSYFVLDKVLISGNTEYYRLVDAYGGKDIMYMDLYFVGDKLTFRSYRSGMGASGAPTKHMDFQAKRRDRKHKVEVHSGFPSKGAEWNFPEDKMSPDWGEDGPETSTSFMWQDSSISISELSALARDPFHYDSLPHLATLKVNVDREGGEKLIVFLSEEAIIENGKMKAQTFSEGNKLFNGVMHFPELTNKEKSFDVYPHAPREVLCNCIHR